MHGPSCTRTLGQPITLLPQRAPALAPRWIDGEPGQGVRAVWVDGGGSQPTTRAERMWSRVERRRTWLAAAGSLWPRCWPACTSAPEVDRHTVAEPVQRGRAARRRRRLRRPAPPRRPAARRARPRRTAEPTALTIDITIAGGKVSPNGKKINIEVGQKVILNVTSDEDDEIHAHTDGDGYELEVKAGEPATRIVHHRQPGQLRGRVPSPGEDHRDLERALRAACATDACPAARDRLPARPAAALLLRGGRRRAGARASPSSCCCWPGGEPRFARLGGRALPGLTRVDRPPGRPAGRATADAGRRTPGPAWP